MTTVIIHQIDGTTLGTALTTTYSYDPAGNKTSELLPNGVETDYTYDSMNRLMGVITTRASGTVTLSTQTYTLADNGNRSGLVEVDYDNSGANGTTTTSIWTYDAENRLINESVASTAGGQSYTNAAVFDLVGNRLSQTHAGLGGADTISDTYNARDELMQEVSILSGTTTNAYDANGSLISTTNGAQVNTYGYDLRNKMVSFSSGGTSTAYVYDDGGNRVSETIGTNAAVFYLTDTQNPTGYAQPVEARSSATSSASITYLIGDHVFGQATSSTSANFFIIDGHGSTRALTDASGNLSSTWLDYDAYGGALNFSLTAPPTNILFGGDAVFDPASGLYMHGDGVRDRAAGSPVFIQMDSYAGSSSDPVTLHKYLYVDADPINGWDPSGHIALLNEEAELGIDSEVEELNLMTVGVARTVVQKTVVWALLATISSGFVALGTGSDEVDSVPERILRQYGFIGADDTTGEVPIYYEPSDEFPYEAENALAAIKANPFKALLHYAADGATGADVRRREAIAYGIKHQYGGNDPRTVALDSLDEYPFASTLEGGPGANFVPAPLEENINQGQDLRSFYRHEQFNQPGEPFLVIVVPRRDFLY